MTVYRNLQFWDGITDDIQEGDICVSDSKFSNEGGEVRDLKGLYAIPGLIDAHIHLCLDPDVSDPLEHGRKPRETQLAGMRSRAEAMVRAGITTARDLGGGQWLELEIRDEIASGMQKGPRLICAGQPITSVGGHCHFWGGEATDTESAKTVLERQVGKGVDLIKIMVTGGNITPGSKPVDSQFDDDTVMDLVKESSARKLHVAAHCHGTEGIRQAAVAGVRTVEHCSWVGASGWSQAYDQHVVETMVGNDVYVSPTINAGWQRFRKPEFVEMVQGNYRKMKSAGIRLIASTDAGIPRVYHHHLPRALPEFARFAELSNLEVLKAATSLCAEAIDLGAITGRIAVGYAADFVVYEANPLEDLSVLENPVLVVADGREVN